MPLPGIQNPAVPYGSLVVVSGASGFIGSHVADQALAAGYRVRGTTRSITKSAWVGDHFKQKYGIDSFELVEVPDMAATSAFDQAVLGASGFFHVAHDMTKSTDPGVAISIAVNGALNALKASSKEPSMKRFVYTSSSFAATLPKPGKVFTVSVDTFNQESVDEAWKPGPRGEAIYAASKVETERAILKWIQENDSRLVVNMILPNANIGPMISSANQGYPTSARWVKALWDSNYDSLKGTPAQYFINVQDDARLHVIALADPNLQTERIFAMTGPVNLNDIIKILRKQHPERDWDDLPDDEKDLSIIEPIQRAEQLHQEAYGTGFIGLEKSVEGNAADLVEQ